MIAYSVQVIGKRQNKLIFAVLFLLSLYAIPYTLSPHRALAQEFSLSITPPISQILIKPGTTVTQTYRVSSSGLEGLHSIHIFPFSPAGENGEIFIDENKAASGKASWFSLLEPQIGFGDKFNLAQGSATTAVLQITVPPDAIQKDYYYAVIFQHENDRDLGQPFSQISGRIGSNLLISVVDDENPFRIAEIKEFSAPLIIDSLAKINYSVILKNVGRTLFRPTGKISVRNFLSKDEVNLDLAPQNVLAYSQRKISCLKDEELIDCAVPSPILLGLYQARLSFTMEGQEKVYRTEITTLALPFSPIAVLIIIVFILKMIEKRRTI